MTTSACGPTWVGSTSASATPGPSSTRCAPSASVPSTNPVEVGGEPFHLTSLDFGPDSVDGWLNHIAAAELGESVQPFLDEHDRSVDLGGARIQLSPLEFGVLNTLAAHPAAPVSRADLIRDVWGTSYDGGSNTVDVVIRSLRRKLGAVADRIETVRGVGYRLR